MDETLLTELDSVIVRVITIIDRVDAVELPIDDHNSTVVDTVLSKDDAKEAHDVGETNVDIAMSIEIITVVT